jgi:hypothetical protein
MLPTSLEAATIGMMAPDSIARQENVLGNDLVEHFGGTREHEVKLWNEAVTAWEGMSRHYALMICANSTRSRAVPGAGLKILSRCSCVPRRVECTHRIHFVC